jgi:hypothetical protein
MTTPITVSVDELQREVEAADPAVGDVMKNHGLAKLLPVAGSERGPRPTLTQQLHGLSRRVRFHMRSEMTP